MIPALVFQFKRNWWGSQHSDHHECPPVEILGCGGCNAPNALFLPFRVELGACAQADPMTGRARPEKRG